MLQWKAIYLNKTSLPLRQVNLRLDKKKCCYCGWILKYEGSISPSNFDEQLSEILVTCLCPTISVNGSELLCFLLCSRALGCYCGWIRKYKGSISLPNLIGNHRMWYSYITALILGWMAVRLGDKCEIRKYMFTLITLNKENPTTQKVVLVMENYHLNQEKFRYLSNLHKTLH